MRSRRNIWLDETIPSGCVDIIRATRVGSELNAHAVSTAICRTKNGYRSRDAQILLGTPGVPLSNATNSTLPRNTCGPARPARNRLERSRERMAQCHCFHLRQAHRPRRGFPLSITVRHRNCGRHSGTLAQLSALHTAREYGVGQVAIRSA